MFSCYWYKVEVAKHAAVLCKTEVQAVCRTSKMMTKQAKTEYTHTFLRSKTWGKVRATRPSGLRGQNWSPCCAWCTHTHTRTHTHTHAHAHANIHTHTQIHTHIHTHRARTHTHTHTAHAHTHRACTHTHTHTHTRTAACYYSQGVLKYPLTPLLNYPYYNLLLGVGVLK